MDRGSGASYYAGESITICVQVSRSVSIRLTNIVNGTPNASMDFGFVNSQHCSTYTISPPTGDEVMRAEALVNGQVVASSEVRYRSQERQAAAPERPAAPTNLVYSTLGTFLYIGEPEFYGGLQWRDNSSNEDGFRIADDTAVVATVAAGVQLYEFGSLRPYGRCFRVQAFNSAGDSAWSNRECVPAISAPQALTVRLSCSPSPLPVGETVTCTGSATPSRSDATILTGLLDFGDGALEVWNPGDRIEHRYADGPQFTTNYTVTLTVGDSDRQSARATTNVTVFGFGCVVGTGGSGCGYGGPVGGTGLDELMARLDKIIKAENCGLFILESHIGIVLTKEGALVRLIEGTGAKAVSQIVDAIFTVFDIKECLFVAKQLVVDLVDMYKCLKTERCREQFYQHPLFPELMSSFIKVEMPQPTDISREIPRTYVE